MRFETQTNLYDQQPLITKLTSHDTRFDVVQGEINALISESEMTELKRIKLLWKTSLPNPPIPTLLCTVMELLRVL